MRAAALCHAQKFFSVLQEVVREVQSNRKWCKSHHTVSCFYGSSTGQLGRRRLDGLIWKGIFRFPFYLPQGKVALFQGSWFMKRNKYPMYIYPSDEWVWHLSVLLLQQDGRPFDAPLHERGTSISNSEICKTVLWLNNCVHRELFVWSPSTGQAKR